VPSGGTVTFVNSSPNDLQLTVGGREYPLAKNASLPLVFPGAADATRSDVTASPLGGVVGGLLASTATVNVGAASPTTTPSANPANTGGTGIDPGTPNAPVAPVRLPGQSGNVVPLPSPGGVTLPPNFGRDPVARGGMARAGAPRTTDAEAGAALPDPTQARADDAARVDSEVTTVGGGIGLLILVATVLLGGVGAAAIRTVLAQRGAVMHT